MAGDVRSVPNRSLSGLRLRIENAGVGGADVVVIYVIPPLLLHGVHRFRAVLYCRLSPP